MTSTTSDSANGARSFRGSTPFERDGAKAAAEKAAPFSLAVTIDVEDWVQSSWDVNHPITDAVIGNVQRLLERLARRRVAATMFIQGRVAEAHPELVRRIAAAGHEIGSHGFHHIPICRQTRDDFRRDVRDAKARIEDLAGCAVLGYRAPDFSVVQSMLWPLEALAEAGHVYDSSIVSTLTPRYGIDSWPVHPVRLRLPSGASLVELPLPSVRVLGRRWPVAGGGYHRLLPWWLIRRIIRHHTRRGGTFIYYCHPYEFNPQELRQLDVKIPWLRRLHQGLGRRGFGRKFDRMIAEFTTGCARDVALSALCPDFAVKGG